MNVVSLKRTDADKAEEMADMGCCASMGHIPDYGWGLRLSLSDAEVKKLRLDSAAINQRMRIEGVAVVVSVSDRKIENGDGKSERNIELLITDLGADPAARSDEEIAAIMYPTMNKA